jgi:hypothetical protein
MGDASTAPVPPDPPESLISTLKALQLKKNVRQGVTLFF